MLSIIPEEVQKWEPVSYFLLSLLPFYIVYAYAIYHTVVINIFIFTPPLPPLPSLPLFRYHLRICSTKYTSSIISKNTIPYDYKYPPTPVPLSIWIQVEVMISCCHCQSVRPFNT